VLSTAETGFASAVCWPSLSAAIASNKRRRWPMDAIPQLAQVLSREAAQNLLIDVVVAERGHISFEPEAAQPLGHIHVSCLRKGKPRRPLQRPAQDSVQASNNSYGSLRGVTPLCPSIERSGRYEVARDRSIRATATAGFGALQPMAYDVAYG